MGSSEVVFDEKREYEMFEYVTEALEDIDNYENSKDNALLQHAHDQLQKVLEIDRRHFKARYFQAMVAYLGGKPEESIEKFRALLQHEEVRAKKPLANEINYNLAAAYSEAEYWPLAIGLFIRTINNTRDNLELNLLARAGLLKTHAYAEGQVVLEREVIKNHYRKIRGILSRNPFRWLLSRIRRKKRIDKKVRIKVKELIAEARAKEHIKFQASRLPLVIFIGFLLFFLALAVAAVIFMSLGVRLQ